MIRNFESDPNNFAIEELWAEDVYSHSVAYMALKWAVKDHMAEFCDDPRPGAVELKELAVPLADQNTPLHSNVSEAFANANDEELACELPHDGPDQEIQDGVKGNGQLPTS